MSRARFLDGVSHAGLIDPAQWKCELGTGGLRLGLGLWLGGGGGGGGSVNPYANGFSTNLNDGSYYIGARMFTNLLMNDVWKDNAGVQPYMATQVDKNGDMVSIPTSGVASRAPHNPNVSGVVGGMTVAWKGSTTGITMNGGSPSGVTTAGGYNFRTYTHTWGTFELPSVAMTVTQASLGAGAVPTDAIVVETDLYLLYGPDNLPFWHPDYVAWLKAQPTEYLRFMDLMNTNFTWSNPVAWSDRSEVPAVAAFQQRAARLRITTGADTLVVTAQKFYRPGSDAYFAARLGSDPPDPIHERGNKIKFAIATPTAGGGVSVVDTVPGEVTITVTPVTGATGTAAIVAQMNGNTACRNWVEASGTGTTAHSTLAATNLQYGQSTGAPGGLPVELMIELCDLTDKKPWFTTPFRADDNYITQFYTLVNTLLPSKCRPPRGADHNETWNTGFKLTDWLFLQEAATGKTPATLRGENFARVMTLAKAACPDLVATLETKLSDPTDLSTILAVSGVQAVVDDCAGAPYIASATIWSTPSATTDMDTLFNRAEATVPTVVGQILANATIAKNAGKTYSWYEWNQNVVGGAPDLATQRTFQRHPRMRRLLGILLSEAKRRVEDAGFPIRTKAMFTDVFPIDNGPAGAWGFHEQQLSLDANSPKYQAVLDAFAGVYPAYYEPGTAETLPVATPYIGTAFAVTTPTVYNSVGSPIYLWKANGAAAGGTNNTASYTPVAGDLGKTLTRDVTYTGTNGETFTYTSPTSSAVQALTKWAVYRIAELSAAGGNIPRPSDWNNASNKIYALGNGGRGFAGTSSNSCGGGGSGGFSRADNVTLASSTAATIGAGGSGASVTGISGVVTANGGANATGVSAAAAAGGAAGTGTFTRAGSNGGSVSGTFHGCAGGAGAPGPDGVGGTGSTITTGSSGTGGGGANGGANAAGGGSSVQPGGNNRLGTGGGSAGAPAGGAGTNGGGGGGGAGAGGHGGAGSNEIYFTDSVTGVQVGFGGGGGGAGASANSNGGAGGYGAGGGGAINTGTAGPGGDGWIVLEWNP